MNGRIELKSTLLSRLGSKGGGAILRPPLAVTETLRSRSCSLRRSRTKAPCRYTFSSCTVRSSFLRLFLLSSSASASDSIWEIILLTSSRASLSFG